MITIEHTPFKTVQYFTVKVELDTVYTVEVEKTMNGSTEYECTCKSYIDEDTKEVVSIPLFNDDGMSKEAFDRLRIKIEMAEDTVLNHVKKHGIGNANKEDR